MPIRELSQTRFLHPLAPVPSHWTEPLGRKFAVGIILFPQLDQSSVVLLTRRSLTVRTHKGQIGFPGGAWENGDIGPADTIARELFEEIGLPRQAVTYIGAAPTVNSLEGAPIIPLVGIFQGSMTPRFVLSDEVADTFFVPATALAASAAQECDFCIFGMRRSTPVFTIDSHIIWGLTAKIIVNCQFAP